MPTHFLVFYINCYIHQRKHMIFVVLDWRISLSIMISSCIHFVTKDNLSWIGLGSRCSEWQPSNTLFVCFPPFLVSLACLPIPFPGTLAPSPHNCHAPSSQVLLEESWNEVTVSKASWTQTTLHDFPVTETLPCFDQLKESKLKPSVQTYKCKC